MPVHIDYNDPKYAESAAEILRRHASAEPEANITSAVRNFLTATGLVKDEEIVEENPPAQGSRRAVDLTALDTFIEFKRRLGTTGGFNPDPEYVQQLDDYLAQSEEAGRVRMGVLTDGKYWLLRWPGAGTANVAPPYAFTLEDPDRWITLYEWLRDNALSAEENKQPSRSTIAEHFGPNSPSYQRDIAALKALYAHYADSNTIKVKKQLWQNLLIAALGEVAAPSGTQPRGGDRQRARSDAAAASPWRRPPSSRRRRARGERGRGHRSVPRLPGVRRRVPPSQPRRGANRGGRGTRSHALRHHLFAGGKERGQRSGILQGTNRARSDSHRPATGTA